MAPLRCRHIFLLLLLGQAAYAAEPPGYYAGAQNLSGAELRAALHAIIENATALPYSAPAGTFDTSDALRVLEEAPGDSSRVILVYSGFADLKSNFGLTSGWNREHLWPQSYGTSSGFPRVDLHSMRASDATVNSSRGNLPFDDNDPLAAGYANPAHAEAPGSTRDFNSWEPRDSEKGDIARALLCLDVRYEGDDGEPDLALTDNMALVVSGNKHMGRLTTLLEWILLDPVNAAEQLRNDAVHALYQGNRNPFVDHPEWITDIFGAVFHLELSHQPGVVTLAWPTGLRRCHLQACTDLQSWADVTLPVVTIGDQDTVTVATVGSWFFRLQLR